MAKSLTTLEELELYVFLLEDLYEEVFVNKNQIVELLKKEFGIIITVEDIERLQNPTIEEEDIKLQMKHVI